MKKCLPLILIIFSLLFISCPSDTEPDQELNYNSDDYTSYTPQTPDAENNSHQKEPMTEKAALAYFRDEELLVGWNLGNTLDSHSGGVGGETIWGVPAVNQAIMDGVKAAGFNIIRVPITWMGHIGSAPDYHIAEARLKRVAEVVDMAHTAGLKVIINLHHDGSTPNATSEQGWLSINKSLSNPADKDAITTKFARVWIQIGKYFRNYGDWLIFEAFNELHDGRWFWSNREVPREQYELVNEWAQIFTDVVRATGGNNDKRYLVIPSYCTGMEALLTSQFVLPKDSVENKLIVSFHYYRPDGFALNGGSTTWDTSGSRNEITSKFSQLKVKFIDKNIPVIIGETGPVRNKDAAGDANRITYITFLFGQAKNNGLVPFYWDNAKFDRGGDGFGLFNRTTGLPSTTSAEFNDCIEAMINAVK